MFKLSLKRIFSISLLLMLTACGGNNGSSSTDGGSDVQSSTSSALLEPNLAAQVVGPNLNGSEWKGFIKSERDGVFNLTATVRQEGNKLTIVTSKNGLGHEFNGTITAAGSILVFDEFDGENWTTFYGNVSKNSINLADLIVEDGRNVDVSILILKR